MKTTTTYRMSGRKVAWKFMRACDAAGISAGYPSLGPEADGLYTVQVGTDGRGHARAITLLDQVNGEG